MKKLIQLLTLTALLMGASAHAMETPEQLGQQLLDAAKEGNLELVQQLLLQGASVDATDPYGQTPLMLAAYYGHTNVSQLLLDHGASVDAKCRAGNTPLMIAADRGRTNICQLLLDNKASVDATDGYGQTPLMYAVDRYAADRGHTNTCRLLIDTIVTQIKNSKAMAIALLGLKNRGKISCLNPIDKNVIRLIARKVVYDSAPSREKQRQSLFAQIDTICINQRKQELLAYAHEKLNTKSTSNQGNSDE